MGNFAEPVKGQASCVGTQPVDRLTKYQVATLRELILEPSLRGHTFSRRLLDEGIKCLNRTATLDTLYDDFRRLSAHLVMGMTGIQLESFPCWGTVPLTEAPTVKWIRQVLGFFSRLEGDSPIGDTLVKYAERVSRARGRIPSPWDACARRIVQCWLGRCPDVLSLKGAHGPGAVAEGIKPWAKDTCCGAIPRKLLPLEDMLYLNERHKETEPHRYNPARHAVTRVVVVPKDRRRRRIISAEPMHMQYLQHALSAYIMHRLEFERHTPIRFTDQTVNATAAGRTDLATLDLSDASDTVSRRIVRQLFAFDSEWVDLLFRLRSDFAHIQCAGIDRVVPLRAYAPMGSALCFPIESLAFAAITITIIAACKGTVNRIIKKGTSCDAYWEAANDVYVYGDDIIVPREYACQVVSGLESCGFLPNQTKSCVDGLFRESCGAEYFNGTRVEPVRPKAFGLTAPRGHSAVPPMVDIANRLAAGGFTNAASYIASNWDYPVAVGNYPGQADPRLPWRKPGKIRWNPKLQAYEQQTMKLLDRGSDKERSGYTALMEWFHSGARSCRSEIGRAHV